MRDVRDEVDLTVNYDLAVGDNFGISMGLIVYMNPDAEPFFHTEELYLSAAYDLGLGFSVGGGVYGDLNAFLGIYATAGVGYSLELAKGLTLDIGTMASMTAYKDAGFAFVESGGTVGMTYAVSDEVSLGIAGLGNYNVDAGEGHYAANVSMGYAW